MFQKIQKFLTSRLVLTYVLFVWFILLALVVFNSFYPKQVPFKKEYLYLVHFLVVYLNIFLLIYIWQTKDCIIDSRYLFLAALNLLIYTPFYLILKEKKIAEQLAIYAYYCMVWWVVLEIILMILSSKKSKWTQKSI